MQAPSGSDRTQQTRELMQACERLYTRDQQPAYLWNALEVACRAELAQADIFVLVGRLNETLGHEAVSRRIQAESLYATARPALANGAAH